MTKFRNVEYSEQLVEDLYEANALLNILQDDAELYSPDGEKLLEKMAKNFATYLLYVSSN